MRNSIESTFLYHEPCPKCGSRDNLGVWSDGHKYCFGCGLLVVDGTSRIIISNPCDTDLLSPVYPGEQVLPIDISRSIPDSPMAFLQKYGITELEIADNKILWSEHKKYLCFPYFGEDWVLEAWQARYFGTNPDIPKWITHGKIGSHIKIFNLTRAEEEGIILCEDIISAIKIARRYPVSPLFGSHCDWRRLGILARYTNKLTFWLDADKYKEARKFSIRANKLGLESRVIYSTLDPKDYSMEQIEKFYLQ